MPKMPRLLALIFLMLSGIGLFYVVAAPDSIYLVGTSGAPHVTGVYSTG